MSGRQQRTNTLGFQLSCDIVFVCQTQVKFHYLRDEAVRFRLFCRGYSWRTDRFTVRHMAFAQTVIYNDRWLRETIVFPRSSMLNASLSFALKSCGNLSLFEKYKMSSAQTTKNWELIATEKTMILSRLFKFVHQKPLG